MKQEDKELSFIDISGRLHYGVIVNYKENKYDHRKWKITSLHVLSYSKSGTLIDTDYDGWISYEEHEGCGMSSGSRPFRFGEVLPYLRPMSSMTDEEKREFQSFYPGCFGSQWLDTEKGTIDIFECSSTITLYLNDSERIVDWLNKNMFDYRGLIEKGLAIAMTKENNPYK